MDKRHEECLPDKSASKASFWLRRKRKQKQEQKNAPVMGESRGRNRSATIEAFSSGELDLKGLLEKHKTPLKPKESCNQSSRLLPSLSTALKSSLCLTYFLEYLQNDNSKTLLDFWLSVEAFQAVAKQRLRLKSRGKSLSKDTEKFSSMDKEAEKTCEELERLCLSGSSINSAVFAKERDCAPDGVNSKDCFTQLKFNNDWQPFSSGLPENSKPPIGPENDSMHRTTHRSKSFLGDALNVYERYLSLDASCVVVLPANMRQRVEGNICKDPNSIDPECFAEAQDFAFSELEQHHSRFLSSHFGRKYQLNLIGSTKLSLQDVVYDSMGLFYFTEFMELEQSSAILEFWLTAENFERQFESRIRANCYDIDECLEDAMAIYEKYFSMRSTCRLIFDDKLRIVLENNICRADGPQPNCFCIPMAYAWTVLKDIFFPRFLASSIYSRYLKDLEKSAEDRCADDDSLTSSEARSSAMISESSSEWDLLGIDSEAIWQRPGTGRLALGHVDKFGIFHSESEPEPEPDGKRQSRQGSKFRSALKKFIANESADVNEEQLAMERAQKIIADVQRLNNLS